MWRKWMWHKIKLWTKQCRVHFLKSEILTRGFNLNDIVCYCSLLKCWKTTCSCSCLFVEMLSYMHESKMLKDNVFLFLSICWNVKYMHESWLQLGCNGYCLKHIKYIENHKKRIEISFSMKSSVQEKL